MSNVKNLEIDETVKSYYNDLKSCEPLTKSEEHELIKQYRLHNDIEARNKLITANLKYACQLANNYRNRGVSYSDLISEANNGLIESIDKFDLNQDVKLISYSKWWIMQKMQIAIAKKMQMPYSELPEDHDAPLEDNENEVSVKTRQNLNEDTFLIENEENEDEMTNMEFIEKILSTVSERESDMINMYYGRCGYNESTLEEIGKKYKLTKERVRQIIETAFRKIRTEAMVVDSKYLSR